MERVTITLRATIKAPVETVWKCWTSPEHITGWNAASDDWHTRHATNDLRAGGKFNSRMEARDGSEGFDFWGIYDEVVHHKKLDSTLGDGRKLTISFTPVGNTTEVVESFETEDQNSHELQRAGWQAILDNFVKYTEALV
ncbi:MAG: polyketide cyclase [Bacteroidetes bacterium GWF2_49_14]|nr:MAG: polyketide cyclase [Bacteroidetes bacterium GWF2_49_14]HBB93165.1 polyketide cyclase [Bacteroidales bacterium]